MRLDVPARVLLVLLILLIAGAAYGGYRFYEFSVAHDAQVASSTAALAELTRTLQDAEQINEDLAFALAEEKDRNDAFAEQIENLSGTVGKLDKLSKTDEELLQKYSKVYFLNENYIPSKLVQIPQKYMFDADDEFFHENAWPYLKNLLEDAADDNIDLVLVSGYRSFDTQKLLKGDYQVTYGSGANTFSADQGYSEHQLGTTVDFSTKALGGALSGFGSTEAYTWLLKNAHRFGFVLSYPEDNGYYMFEPWHWRFVGKGLARELEDDGKHFYDLDQREIDEHLINIFD